MLRKVTAARPFKVTLALLLLAFMIANRNKPGQQQQETPTTDLRGNDDDTRVLPSVLFSGMGYDHGNPKPEPPATNTATLVERFFPWFWNHAASFSGEPFEPMVNPSQIIRSSGPQPEPKEQAHSDTYRRRLNKFLHEHTPYFLTLYP